MSERIFTIWNLGYFKLFDEAGNVENEKYISTETDDWKKIAWRLYWRCK